MVLASCGNGSAGTSGSTDKGAPEQPIASAGSDQRTMNGFAIQLDGSLSRDYQGRVDNLTYQWEQLAGTTAFFADEDGQTQVSPWIVTPSSDSDETLVFQLTVSDGIEQNSDLVEIDVGQCAAPEGVIFDDCLGKGYGPMQAWEDKEVGEDKVLLGGQGDQHLQWELVDTGSSRGKVIQLTYNANDLFDEVNDNSNFSILVDSAVDAAVGIDISEYAGGALSFDLRMLNPANEGGLMQVGLGCFWPCVSDLAPVPDPDTLNEWQSYSYSLDYLEESGLHMTNLGEIFRFTQPFNRQHGQLIVQIDNIRLSDEYFSSIVVPPLPQSDYLYEVFTENTPNIYRIIWDGKNGPTADLNVLSSGHFELNIHETVFWSPFFIVNGVGFNGSYEDFFHGHIKFEMFVSDYGGNENGNFKVSANCFGFSCRVVPGFDIGRPAEGVWHSIEIPVRELVERGLDLGRTYHPFILDYSAPEKGLDQTFDNSISLQIRNIVWEYVAQ